MRIALVVGLAALTAGLRSLRLPIFSIRPVTLTVAAGSLDGEGARLMNALASRLAVDGQFQHPAEGDRHRYAARRRRSLFAKGDVDLAIVRGDATDLKSARTVVVITHGVLMLLGLPGTSITDFDHLKGKTIGVVGGAVNQRIASVLDSEYDLTRSKVKFVDLTLPEVAAAIQGKKVQALLIVTPISGRYLTHPAQFLPARRPRRARRCSQSILPAQLPPLSAPMKASISRKARSADRLRSRTTT